MTTSADVHHGGGCFEWRTSGGRGVGHNEKKILMAYLEHLLPNVADWSPRIGQRPIEQRRGSNSAAIIRLLSFMNDRAGTSKYHSWCVAWLFLATRRCRGSPVLSRNSRHNEVLLVSVAPVIRTICTRGRWAQSNRM